MVHLGSARAVADTRPGSPPLGPITARIRSLRPAFSPTAARVADAVLADPAEIVTLTVTDLADRTDTSVGSVVRFCQDHLGLAGFHDLKLRLAAENAPPTGPPTGGSSPAGTIDAVLQTAIAGLRELPAALDRETLLRSATELSGATRVLVAGIGTSAPLAHDAAHRLRAAGLHAEAPPDPHQQHLAARMLGTTGRCLAISHTGQTRETLTTLRGAVDAGATTVGITSFHRSPFVELCDHPIVAGATERHGLEATAARLVHLTVVDVLVALLRDLDPTSTRHADARYATAIAAHRV